jgi:enediyne biosynthesis protein E5
MQLSAKDPRLFQILALGSLLAYGIGVLEFDQAPVNVGVLILTALAAQIGFGLVLDRPRAFDLLSPLVTALSLSLILRTGRLELYALAAVLAIGSKFLIRCDGKHVFNPANFAIVAIVMATGDAWVSPGQWGRETLLMFAFAGLGMLVLSRAKRIDVALTFLGSYAALILLRAAYLGDPLAIPIQQLHSGALLLFAFFMITDPKTTPDHRPARLAYAVAVAAIAFALQYQAYMPVGVMYALFLAAPFVPLIDRATAHPGATRFNWSRPN